MSTQGEPGIYLEWPWHIWKRVRVCWTERHVVQPTMYNGRRVWLCETTRGMDILAVVIATSKAGSYPMTECAYSYVQFRVTCSMPPTHTMKVPPPPFTPTHNEGLSPPPFTPTHNEGLPLYTHTQWRSFPPYTPTHNEGLPMKVFPPYTPTLMWEETRGSPCLYNFKVYVLEPGSLGTWLKSWQWTQGSWLELPALYHNHQALTILYM